MTLVVISTEHIGGSAAPVISSDGTKVAFWSARTDLVTGDTNGTYDLYIQDLTTGVITRANTSALGTQAAGERHFNQPVSFSSDGTKIVFQSTANNLVPGDTNGLADIFVKDLVTGAITRVSTDAAGNQVFSANGLFAGMDAVISPDGTKVAFVSQSAEYVPGDSGNSQDLFIKDLSTGSIIRVTNAEGQVPNGGLSDPVFSPDGTKVAFWSWATNLVPETMGTPLAPPLTYIEIYVKDLVTGEVTLVSNDVDLTAGPWISSGAFYLSFSADGTKIAFSANSNGLVPGDTNNTHDVYLRDLLTGNLTRISTDSEGNQMVGDSTRPVLSPDGVHVAFYFSDYFQGGDIPDGNYIKNLVTGELIFLGGDSEVKSFSADGSKIVYSNYGEIVVATLANVITGTNDADTLEGLSLNETIYGQGGDDRLYGGDGADVLYGDIGKDILLGEEGKDTLVGGFGIDIMNGGAESDILTGGYGADTFQFDSASFTGVDRIKDFSLGHGDKIELHDILFGYNPLNSAITDFVKITQVRGNSFLFVDADGAVNGQDFFQIARLDSVTGLTNEAQLLAQGHLLIS